MDSAGPRPPAGPAGRAFCPAGQAVRACFALPDHRLKQQPGWKVDQLPDGTFRWTTPAGRTYDTEPTRYPV
jgi:hypothetical protein